MFMSFARLYLISNERWEIERERERGGDQIAYRTQLEKVMSPNTTSLQSLRSQKPNTFVISKTVIR